MFALKKPATSNVPGATRPTVPDNKKDEESLNTNGTEEGIRLYLRKVPDTGLTSSTSDRGLLDKGEAIGQTDVTQHLKCLTLSFFHERYNEPQNHFSANVQRFFSGVLFKPKKCQSDK